MNELGPAIYMDASALVKLTRPEPESLALKGALDGRPGVLTSSVISEVELVRAIRRSSPERLDAAHELLDRLLLLPITSSIRVRAQRLKPATVRSLDAIHIGTGLEIAGDLDAVVTYDHRMIETCTDLDLPVISPGSGASP